MTNNREIAVDYLARVEGEGAMYLELDGDEVVDLKFKIFEPPRFFEAFLRGRQYAEAPDITARICGICPIAYQTSAVNAMEDILGTEIPDHIQLLRRLIYCGEWIESHGLHVLMLHAPDFLGYASGIAMASDFPEQVTAGLQLKKTGNEIVTVVGGREIHPINMRVGGFYRLPTNAELNSLVPSLEQALATSLTLVDWVAGFPFPDFERDYEFVSMQHPDEYPMARGRVVSNRGLDISVQEWPEHFAETHVEWSNALHAHRIEGGGTYHVGPMARYSLNRELLTPAASQAASAAGLEPECRNPFKSIIVRAVEIIVALEEALRLIDAYDPDSQPATVSFEPKAGVGHGVSEAPRGLLYHRYEIDSGGVITDAHIVPPTSQNQASIEDDLRAYVPGRAHLEDDELQWQLEQAIRNYDPCISCATHFLDLTVKRSGSR